MGDEYDVTGAEVAGKRLLLHTPAGPVSLPADSACVVAGHGGQPDGEVSAAAMAVLLSAPLPTRVRVADGKCVLL